MEAMGMGVVGVTLLLVVFYLLVATLLLQLSVRIVEGLRPGFGRALGVVVLASAVGVAANVALGMLAGTAAPVAEGAAAVSGGAWMTALPMNLLLSLLLHTAGIHWLLPQPAGRRISWARAALAALLYVVLVLVLSILVGMGIGLALRAVAPAAA